MTRRHLTCATLALAMIFTAWQPSLGCLHLPANYEGSIEQLAQGGLVFYKQGREDLILNNTFIVKGKDGAQPTQPQSMAWVVPVPNKPLAYAEVEGDVFQAMFDTWEADKDLFRDRAGNVLADVGSKGLGGFDFGTLGSFGVEIVETLGVGAYEITVIQATDAAALNTWLAGNGFGTVPEENMKFYIDNGHTWVCVKTAPEGTDGELKPLRISFATPKVVYPLKFSSHQGTFNVNLWVVTEEPLPLEKSKHAFPGSERIDLSGYRVEGEPEGAGFRIEGRWLELPEAPAAIAAELGFQNTVGTKVPYVTKVSATQMRGAGVKTWTTDLEFTPPAGAEKPPEPVICFPGGPHGPQGGERAGGVTKELEQGLEQK